MIDCRCASSQRGIATGATLAIALLPKFGCPLCAPLLAAVLGMLGLSLQAAGEVFTALTAGFVGLALFLLVRDRRRPAPAALALIAAVIMLTYRLIDLPQSLHYIGSTAFAAALIWRACSQMRSRQIESASVAPEES